MAKFPGLDKIFKGFYVHEQLAFVIVCSAGVDGIPSGRIFLYDGLERIGVPFLQRLRRLDIIVAIDHDGLQFRVDYLLAEDHRVAVAGVYTSLIRSGLHQQDRQPFSAATHVFLMFLFGAD